MIGLGAPAWLLLSVLAIVPVWRLARRKTQGPGLLARRCRAVALALAFIACAVAAAGPVRSAAARIDRADGLPPDGDLVIVLDVSMSMAAADVEPSRLAEARRQLQGMLTEDHGVRRVGLVLFAGDARVSCPLTADRLAIRQAVAGASDEGAAPGGSNVTAALERAWSLVSARPADSAIVVLSDGEPGPEDTAMDFRVAAGSIRDHGVRVVVAGIGTPEGAIVPVRSGARTARGRHHSALNEARLQALASAAGGTYVRLIPGGQLPIVLRSTPVTPTDSGSGFGPERWFGIPLLVALAAIIFDAGVWWIGSPEVWR